MDKVDNNKAILREYLNEWVDFHPDEQTGIPLTIIEDKAGGNFFLMEIGHGINTWVYTMFVHFQVLDNGKVILLANNTDQEPFEELIDMGIDANDLVVGWVPPATQAMLRQRAA